MHVVQSDGQGDGEGDSKGDIPFILLILPTKVNFSYKIHTIFCQPSAVSNTVKCTKINCYIPCLKYSKVKVHPITGHEGPDGE